MIGKPWNLSVSGSESLLLHCQVWYGAVPVRILPWRSQHVLHCTFTVRGEGRSKQSTIHDASSLKLPARFTPVLFAQGGDDMIASNYLYFDRSYQLFTTTIQALEKFQWKEMVHWLFARSHVKLLNKAWSFEMLHCKPLNKAWLFKSTKVASHWLCALQAIERAWSFKSTKVACNRQVTNLMVHIDTELHLYFRR